jgi:hypothetical protein
MRNIYTKEKALLQWILINLIPFLLIYFLRHAISRLTVSISYLFLINDEVTRSLLELFLYILISSFLFGIGMAIMQSVYWNIRKYKIKKWFLITFISYTLGYFIPYFILVSDLYTGGKTSFYLMGMVIGTNIIFSPIISGNPSFVLTGLYSIILGFLFGALFGFVSGLGQYMILRKLSCKKSNWLKSLVVGCGLGNSLFSFIVTMVTNIFWIKYDVSNTYTLPLFFITIWISLIISTSGPIKYILSRQRPIESYP